MYVLAALILLYLTLDPLQVEFTAALERLQQVLKEAQHRVCIVIEGMEVWGTGK